jgi:hypothetical protein
MIAYHIDREDHTVSAPPTYHLGDLGPQAQIMAKSCTNERLAMTLQMMAVGSMIIMAGAATVHLMHEMVGHTEPSRQVKMRRTGHSSYVPSKERLQGKQPPGIYLLARGDPRRASRTKSQEPMVSDGSWLWHETA